MKSKICTKCGIEKPLSEFYNRKQTKDGKRSACKDCINFSNKKWINENREKYSQYQRKYLKENKEHFAGLRKKYRKENPERYSEYGKKHYCENREKRILKSRNWYLKNKDKVVKRTIKRNKKKRKESLSFRIRDSLRARMRLALKGIDKAKSTIKLLGCPLDYFQKHIEQQFKPGMSWDNYGKWEIDHIKPCAMFDFTNRKEQLKCFHYTNLQPLWSDENRRKSNKYEGKTQTIGN